MIGDNLKELVGIQRQKYRVISKADEIQSIKFDYNLHHRGCDVYKVIFRKGIL